MRPPILLFFLTLLSAVVQAQAQTVKVSGFIKNTDNKPLEAASVSLLNAKDSSLVKIAVADKEGSYKFENVKFGRFLLQAEAIGFNKTTSPVFELSSSNASYTAGN